MLDNSANVMSGAADCTHCSTRTSADNLTGMDCYRLVHKSVQDGVDSQLKFVEDLQDRIKRNKNNAQYCPECPMCSTKIEERVMRLNGTKWESNTPFVECCLINYSGEGNYLDGKYSSKPFLINSKILVPMFEKDKKSIIKSFSLRAVLLYVRPTWQAVSNDRNLRSGSSKNQLTATQTYYSSEAKEAIAVGHFKALLFTKDDQCVLYNDSVVTKLGELIERCL